MTKSCSSCQYWQKLKNDELGGGICNNFDSRVSSDDSCALWKGVKYKRIKAHNKGNDSDQ